MAPLAQNHFEYVQEEQEASFKYGMQLALGAVLPMALKTAFELGVFEIIDKAGPGSKLSSSEIVTNMPASNPKASFMLDRLLFLLSTHHVLGCSVDDSNTRLYSINSVSKHFVCNQDGVSLGPFMALIQDEIFLQSWSHLKDAILKGGTAFEMVHGMQRYKYLGLDFRFSQVFSKAMYNQSTLVIKCILESYNGFENHKLLVDVGGGLGHNINVITSKYPSMKGINFDLPQVIGLAPGYPNVEHVGGDMFESVPSGDSIFMKWILQCWSDDECLKLLRNCYKAIPEDGKIIIVEGSLPAMPETSSGAKATCQLDVLLMTQSSAGGERTQQAYVDLAIKAGFGGIKFVKMVCNLWIMELFK